MPTQPHKMILLLKCKDHPGIVAQLTHLIATNQGNILDLEQYTEAEHNQFFVRIHWTAPAMDSPTWERILQPTIAKLNGTYKLITPNLTTNLAILVSKESHCLYDLLARHQSGEINANIKIIIANHPDLEQVVIQFGYKFLHIPIAPGKKSQQEQLILETLAQHNVDSIILARYMQILSPEFIRHYPEHIINIHHSSLPAFAGAKPYHRAWERGVKSIGATAHFVTDDLDEGPIISQATQSISHRYQVNDLINLGKNLEKSTLATALNIYLNHKVIIANNRTIVFT